MATSASPNLETLSRTKIESLGPTTMAFQAKSTAPTASTETKARA